MIITVEYSEAEAKALSTVALDPKQYVTDGIRVAITRAYDEIVQQEVKRLLDAGLPIPSTRDEIVLQSPIETAAERQARFEREYAESFQNNQQSQQPAL